VANTSLNASISLVDLDFATLKTAFQTYLKNQDVFKDYDFDGSNINLLLDLLSYNTFKNAFYLNMAISEGFIDSAQLRNSLLSHAKELNYLPRSVRSAKASVTVTWEATGDNQPYVIPKGSQFSALIKSKAYIFSTPDTLIVSSPNTSFSFTTDIYEGVYKKDAYIFQDNIENQVFPLTNKNVDTNSLSVTVKEDGSSIGDTYLLTTTLLDLNEFSKVFFLQASELGFYEVYFGDNNLGRQPKTNSLVTLDYRLSSGPDGNGAKSFTCLFDPTSPFGEVTSTPVTTTGDVANNGDVQETNESIRYYAPRAFQVQERTVTATDYEVALKTKFPEINAVSVYGGEESTPPEFGKVFIAVDISNVNGLPDSKKDEYTQFIQRRAPLSIIPVFKEAQFMYLSVDSIVRYNLNITTNSPPRIQTIVTDAILSYNTDHLDSFNATLRYSQLLSHINDTDLSIISNITDVQVYKKINPATGVSQNIDISFDLPLLNNLPTQEDIHSTSDQKTISSSLFSYGGSLCTIEDDGNGLIRIIKQSLDKDVKVSNVGTVDYDTGLVKLTNFLVDSYDGDALRVFAVPQDRDIYSNKQTILTMEADAITVTPEGLRQ